ncbi:MAG: DUF5686 and carboxypeptidase regulatory-like domain-containing protein [Muribaculaceae bacterium]|nr:DUF5686 and carboxypeptidase regulatory-like domain-containing protein [Muribaculaceae bacterium]
MGIRFLLTVIAFLFCFSLSARRIHGKVVDSIENHAISLANISIVKNGSPSEESAVADKKGRFSIVLDDNDSVRISSYGYDPVTISVDSFPANRMKIYLTPSTTELTEFIVNPKKQKYSKKNNPAYDLMMKVRNCRKQTNPIYEPYYSYDSYERITLGLNNYTLPEDISSKKYNFMKDYADTARNTGLPILLVSVKEKISKALFSHSPDRAKDIVVAVKTEGIDKSFNQDNINRMLRDILREPDIYSNDINLLQNRFVSPLSHIAGDYYMFHLGDTTLIDGERFVDVSFAPKTPESFGFNGHALVGSRDSLYYIKRIDMRVPRVINLNYIDNIFIKQEFFLDSLGRRHKILDDMSGELQLMPGTQSFYISRLTSRKNFSYVKDNHFADFYDKLGRDFMLQEAETRPDALWNQMRMIPLTKAEASMGSILTNMRKLPWFYWGEKILSVLVQGYVEPVKDSKVFFDAVNTLASYNKAEGVRLRLGAMTTSFLSKRWFARGYLAYGFRDKKLKYNAEVEYSFVDKKLHAREFPVKSLRLTHKYDIDMLGQHYLFTNPDNIFLSIKRKPSYLATYQRYTQFEYRLELNNNFSVIAGVRHERQEATQWVPFILADGRSVPHYDVASMYLQLRYAPGEAFIQGKNNRVPINFDAPVIMLTHEYGPKKLLGSDFTLNRTEISANKRFWFSPFGYADVILKGGKVWSQVQYPALMWPNANLSYTIQPESYSLMNPMEFANDYYGALDLTYWANGTLFNRIPLVKKAKLREVITFKMLMGGLTRKNNPTYNPELYRFPAGARTTTLRKTPYMEIGCGIDNILTFLRIDYMWRLTYRDAPDIDKSGLRISLHFAF